MMVISPLRFAAKGWIEDFYTAPRYHFGWPGFEWLSDLLPTLPAWALYAWFGALGLSAASMMLGIAPRVSALAFFITFATTELTVKEIGFVVRQARLAQGLRQDQLAAAAGVGLRFLVELERGKPSVRLAKVLAVLDALGCRLQVTPPPTPSDSDS
jgi:y4mF family transcriptional regulator